METKVLKPYKNTGKGILRRGLPLLLLAMLAATAYAHKPLMMIEDHENGTFTVTVGFSDGESGAGAPILLKSKTNGEVLWKGSLNAEGALQCPKMMEPYVVRFVDDEPGHSVERDGIVLKAGESAPELSALASPIIPAGAADAKFGETASESSDLILHPQWTLPLKAHFTEEIKRLLADKTVSVRNVLGMVRTTSLMQCLQYHAQSKMGALVAVAEEKVKAGKRVDFELPQAGLCPGALSGFLAMDFAIRELYGDEVPLMDDLRIECKGKMGGIWDAFELILGRRLSRERGVLGPSPKAMVFFAERLSDGKRIVFTYDDDTKARLQRFFEGKTNPGTLPKDEMSQIRQGLVKDLLGRHARKDYSYFMILNGGPEKPESL
ncbi:hypothetical protein L21SP4_01599 [Kiritimatiella glycovorans]|uniref:Uncharacterized protein n=1 Tax=Kiritimatiella glycovorans TaxID=1307763 RepID=A0A0G3EHH3_9BACT|nr:hypothetical protein L21SP4_01599 [Kiritimatiella glycovorans]